MNFLSAALSYLAQDLAVFPVAPGGKTPMTKAGFKEATCDEDTVRSWASLAPEANVGLPTGTGNQFFVLDVDNKNGGMESLASFRSLLPPTYTVRTPSGGLHFYFRLPNFSVRNKQGLFPGVDIRGDGGYVVAPPSESDQGGSYVVEHDTAPAEAPSFLLDALRPVERPAPTGPAPELSAGERGSLNKRTLRFLVDGAAPGTWHQEFYQAAMDFKQNGYGLDEAAEKLSRVTGTLDTTHDWPQLRWVYEKGVTGPPNAPEASVYDAVPGAARGVEAASIPASSLLDELHAYLSDEGLVYGTGTGLPGLDKLLCGREGGGLRPGELISLTAVAKTGKSTLLHKVIHSLLSRGVAVGYASREMSPATEVLPDLLSIELRKDVERGRYTPEAMEQYRAVVSRWDLSFAGGWMDMPWEELEAWIRSLHSRGVTHFFGDHAHLFLADSEEFKELARYLKKLKALVNELKISFFMVVQPKQPGPDGRLNMHSLRGGANLSQLFNAMIMMERFGERSQNLSRVWLEAARSKLATTGEIFLEYSRETRDMAEVTLEPVEPEPATSARPYEQKLAVIAKPLEC